MKHLFAALLLLTSISSYAFAKQSVVVKITNLGPEGGLVPVIVFADADAFPDKISKAVYANVFPLERGVKELSITIELPVGTYALATFHDKNKNKKLDLNIVGAPSERFGFSRNPRIGFSSPNFAECAFEVTAEKKQSLNIGMKKLF